MAKKTHDETDENWGEEGEEMEAERTPLTKAEKKALFADYQSASKTLEEAEATAATARAAISVAVQQIGEQIGSGPFEWRGKLLRVASRNGLFFMRSQSAEAEKIG
jgi:hypothetical protein